MAKKKCWQVANSTQPDPNGPEPDLRWPPVNSQDGKKKNVGKLPIVPTLNLTDPNLTHAGLLL